jgi:hypothetical protein
MFNKLGISLSVIGNLGLLFEKVSKKEIPFNSTYAALVTTENPWYTEKVSGLADALSAYKTQYDNLDTKIGSFSSKADREKANFVYPDSVLTEEDLAGIKDEELVLLDRMDEIINLCKTHPYTLDDLETFCIANFSDEFKITKDEDRGIVRIVRRLVPQN